MSDDNNNQEVRITEADASKSFSHERPEPDTTRPTERPQQSTEQQTQPSQSDNNSNS